MSGYSFVSFRESAPAGPKPHARYEYCTLCLKTRDICVNRPERQKASTGLLRKRVLDKDTTVSSGAKKARNRHVAVARVVKPLRGKAPRPSAHPPDSLADINEPSETSFPGTSEDKPEEEDSQSRQPEWDADLVEPNFTTDQSNADLATAIHALPADSISAVARQAQSQTAVQDSDLSDCYSVRAFVPASATAMVADSNARRSLQSFALSSPWASKEMLQTEHLKRRLQTDALRHADNSASASTELTMTETVLEEVHQERTMTTVCDVLGECRIDCYDARAFGDHPYSLSIHHSRASSGFTSPLSDSVSLVGGKNFCINVSRHKKKRQKFTKKKSPVRMAHRSLSSCLVS
ncbi:hypothetical protein SprV_0602118800 [Sparganum proliferum]